ncbi:MAG: DeoR/GlpR family DNA-binding transcription regulator [Victivallales bacterium]
MGNKEKESKDRLEKIFDFIQKNGFSSPDKIAPVIGVSAITIRRDLKLLKSEGLIKQVYGGVVPLIKNIVDAPVSWRMTRDVERKKKIAEYAASLVKKNETLMIDAGSTCHFLCESLPEDKNLRVITHSIENVNVLKNKKGIEVICPGGILNAKLGAFYGSSTETELAFFFADKSFIGSSGISIMMGCVNSFVFETKIKMIMNTQAKESYILADSSKFEVSGYTSNIPISSIKRIITNSVSPARIKLFKDKNVEIIVAE